MDNYDASKAPDPEGWLELDEQERIDQAVDYHRRHHLPMGNSATLHGIAHAIVENQIAMNDPPATRETLARLMGAGLDRHDAIHAVSSVVMGILFDITRGKDDGGDVSAKIACELADLTIASWRGQE